MDSHCYEVLVLPFPNNSVQSLSTLTQSLPENIHYNPKTPPTNVDNFWLRYWVYKTRIVFLFTIPKNSITLHLSISNFIYFNTHSISHSSLMLHTWVVPVISQLSWYQQENGSSQHLLSLPGYSNHCTSVVLAETPAESCHYPSSITEAGY